MSMHVLEKHPNHRFPLQKTTTSSSLIQPKVVRSYSLHMIVLDLLVWWLEKNIYPEMVIYHGRIRKKSPQKQTQVVLFSDSFAHPKLMHHKKTMPSNGHVFAKSLVLVARFQSHVSCHAYSMLSKKCDWDQGEADMT